MARPTWRPAVRFHLRLVHVPDPRHEFVPDRFLVTAQHRPVVVIELFDDLKGPAPVQHVASDDLSRQSVGEARMACRPQHRGSVADLCVGVTHQLVERVQGPAGAFDGLQGLGDRRYGGVVDPVRPSVQPGAIR